MGGLVSKGELDMIRTECAKIAWAPCGSRCAAE